MKKTNGRKRHIVVDTLGSLLAVNVHAANIHDTKSGITEAMRAAEKYQSIVRFCAGAGYRGTFEREAAEKLMRGTDISERISSGWSVFPKRWVVERTFAWMHNSRRLSKDYEITTASAEAVCMISAIHTLLARG